MPFHKKPRQYRPPKRHIKAPAALRMQAIRFWLPASGGWLLSYHERREDQAEWNLRRRDSSSGLHRGGPHKNESVLQKMHTGKVVFARIELLSIMQERAATEWLFALTIAAS